MSEEAAVAALVNQMKVAPKAPTEETGDQDDEDQDEDNQVVDDGENDEALEAEDDDADEDGEAEDGDDEGTDEDATDEQKAPAAAAVPADDAVVKVTVNGEETEVTIGSLKRLAGQEATLTRKSQEADAVGGRAALLIQGALETIAEDLAPYDGFDWILASHEMEPEEFKWHRENYTRNETRYNALIKQAGEFETTIKARQEAATQEQATAAHTELVADVPGWSDKLYGDILKYGVSQGLEADDVANIANAKVIKLLHKAMLHDTAATAVAKKVNLTPARVKATATVDEAQGSAPSRQQRTLEKKMASGRATDDDAVALLMGRWKN